MNSDPDPTAHAHIARAQVLLRERDNAGARAAAAQALRHPPVDIVARNTLGSVLYELGDLDAARDLFAGVLAENPRYGDALNNLGNILARDGKPRAAVEFYERALAEAPSNPDFLANLGGARQALGDVAGALSCFERALALDPAHGDARWNRAIARLLSGDLAGGFADYEVRWTLPEFMPRRFAVPQWRGEDLAKRTILIHSEQGYGDTIQMARFARTLKQRGGRVLLETHAVLARLMRGSDLFDGVIVRGEALPAFDLHIPIMSLPFACGLASVRDIPGEGPYLRVPAEASVDLAQGGGLRVGLVWRGRPTHKNDLNRSLAASALAPLSTIAGLRLYSLQLDSRADERDVFPGIVDLAPQLVDFAATAAALAQLDLVIAADTAVAHLAGALGREAWILLPFAPDWRWLLDREDSPWYPSLRLFRQTRIGDWASPVARIVEVLAERTARAQSSST